MNAAFARFDSHPARGTTQPATRRRRAGGRQAGRRRGIILLMSLSLLVLFLMMLVTLVVISGQYRQSARVQARADRTGDPPQKLLDMALMAALRDDPAGASGLLGHSLTEDIYGRSWRGRVVTPTTLPTGMQASTNGHITLELELVSSYQDYLAGDLYETTTNGEFAGNLLTFVSPSTTARQNVSVRILEYRAPITAGGHAWMSIARTNPEEGDGLFDTATMGDAIGVGDVFVVNDKPFSGYGAGYYHNDASDETAGHNISLPFQQKYSDNGAVDTNPLPAGAVNLPAALLPNFRDIDPTLAQVYEGGANEDYDALDYQNMFLAYLPASATRADQIVPSFWRPELLNYWRHYTFDHDGNPTNDNLSLWYPNWSSPPAPHPTNLDALEVRNDFYRRLTMRPLWCDHPDFTGSNPDFGVPLNPNTGLPDLTQPFSLLTGSNDIDENATADQNAMSAATVPPTWPPMPGTIIPPMTELLDAVQDVNGNKILDQWDVDNDGDGLTDSVWVDVGLPVQRTADGKLYKPLVAFMIRDLDGLSNLNAHMHSAYKQAKMQNLVGTTGVAAVDRGPLAGGNGATLYARPKGRGYGPAELGLSYELPYQRTVLDYTSGLPVQAPAAAKLLDDDDYDGNAATDTSQMSSLLFGYGTGQRPGRYGLDTAVATAFEDFQAGRDGVDDPASQLIRHDTPRGLPDAYPFGAVTAYGSPPDVWGASALAIDFDGRPWIDRVGFASRRLENYGGGGNDSLDEPYEIDLYAANSGVADFGYSISTPDVPYTLAELERILRWNDADAGFLPSRLIDGARPALAPLPNGNFSAFGLDPDDPTVEDTSDSNGPLRRRLVTTLSSHVPAPATGVPAELRSSDEARDGWLYDLYKNKLITDGTAPSNSRPFKTADSDSDGVYDDPPYDDTLIAHRNWIDGEINKMMPPEIRRGMKFDVNRRWQNGFDDNNNGVVDEPGEAIYADGDGNHERIMDAIAGLPVALRSIPNALLATLNAVEFDHLAGDTVITGTVGKRYARQIYARQLYCLALTALDYNGIEPPATPPPGYVAPTGFDPRNAFEYAFTGANPRKQADELFKRKLAQWAINAVDFRDPDAICSPFEYDVNPFNGWQSNLDGNPGTVPSFDHDNNPGTPNGPGDRRLVWGMESPDLLITETLAFHQRRVKDTNQDDGDADYRRTGGDPMNTTEADDDLDQYRIPQGSLFVELYATGNRTSNDPQFPRELYDPTTGALDVGRLAPDGAPVWRMAVSVRQVDAGGVQVDFEDRVPPGGMGEREITSFETYVDVGDPADPLDDRELVDLNLLSQTNPSDTDFAREPLEIERYVWLGPSDPNAWGGAANLSATNDTFYARSIATNGVLPTGQTASTGLVLPGRYAVVGPRENTVLGTTDTDADPATLEESPQRISLAPVGGYDWAGTETPDATTYLGGANQKIFRGTPIICGANLPQAPATAWGAMGGPTHGIGMNISEPLPQGTAAGETYYKEPQTTIIGTERDAYNDGEIPDRPLDETTGPLSDGPAGNEYFKTRTHNDLRRAVFLQRLADPTQPFHATINPYLTFDWQPVDLTVFNGDDRRPDGWAQSGDPATGELDNFDPSDDEPLSGNNYEPDSLDVRLMSRERGNRDRTADSPDTNNQPAGAVDWRLWPHTSEGPWPTNEATAAKTANQLKFRFNVLHTLGYLNVTMGMDHLNPGLDSYTLPSDGSMYEDEYLGVPPGGAQGAFPWITWFDRPFSSPYELMFVPHTSQSMLGSTWSADKSTAGFEVYSSPAGQKSQARGMYNHLLNFFHFDAMREPNSTTDPRAPQLYRLFDYLETPSPYAGAQEYVYDMTTGGTWGAPGTLTRGNNYLSRMRDPGRINLNTMPKEVWGAFTYSHDYGLAGGTNAQEQADNFAKDRRGFHRYDWTDPTPDIAGYPTRIAHPYRDAAKADLAPLLPNVMPPERLRYEGIEATLMRSIKTAGATPLEPLFAGPRHTGAANAYQNSDRNPYFRFEQLTRMPNLTSNHSNVYAIWMTVGYFEATKQSPDVTLGGTWANYAGQPLPDGVWLGKEIGSDDGQVRRHRAFFIIDRSIPVAFERGNDHNVEKTILLRRYLD